MIKNPVQLRVAKLAEWQQRLFMACLCERMYPNFAFYCQQVNSDNMQAYRKILDLVWESLLVKEAKINFDLQLEKLEAIIPIITEESPYLIYPAIDACEALGEVLHSYLSNDIDEHSAQVSSISAMTIAEMIMTQQNKLLTIDEQMQLAEVIEEFDLQWEIFRTIRDESEYNRDIIKGLRDDIKDAKVSNIGVFLGN
ncbi:DUF416 family protein [Orbaceae bacterium ESL0727]|nr:DUF416 family protein [Orbaceae bacterium ESL0727]